MTADTSTDPEVILGLMQTVAEMSRGLDVCAKEVDAYVRTPLCRDAMRETLAAMRAVLTLQDELVRHLR